MTYRAHREVILQVDGMEATSALSLELLKSSYSLYSVVDI